ncbi:MAG TPA: tryptophan synthase subunit alpha [Saprospiraceae bacterium]|nr:tryptophan synthase subunit alpha [Saprospiraceae bacterium]HPG06281.1 tryptophan synthase subunit alpha [Saprospiraceae bacterium]HRV85249.1 tryptophan synthase subunit alpha [Saprospiraceae bacterium]
MNRLDRLFQEKKQEILNIYFTAGYPGLGDTVKIIRHLADAGVDLVEIGIPYSDPLADGPTIQASSEKALANGMTLDLLFQQVKEARQQTDIPFILMGYFNPVLQYGEDRFFRACVHAGVDGLIIPDMPLHEYEQVYREKLKHHGLKISFLITPQTPEDRIRKIDDLSNGFIYMVSSSSITGAKTAIQASQLEYFRRVQAMHLKHPRLIGFGISNYETFNTACHYAAGAIVGSAFIKQLGQGANVPMEQQIHQFVQHIKNPVEA